MIMENITDMRVTPCPPNSPYIAPMRLLYKQAGKEKFWDLIKVHDSVSIIIYNRTSRSLVFVRQFRPGVYLMEVADREHERRMGLHDTTPQWKLGADNIDSTTYAPGRYGFTYELCAGIVDKKGLTLEKCAAEEILEETGFQVEPSALEKVTSYRSGVGVSGAKQTMYYCEVDDSMRATAGGGNDAELEMLEVIEIPAGEVREKFILRDDCLRPADCCFAVLWFLDVKWPAIQKVQRADAVAFEVQPNA